MANYKDDNNRQGIFMSISLDDQLIPGTIEHAIYGIVENHIDTSIFDGKYKNDGSGRKAYSPKTMIKIILLAYSKGIFQSRRIEEACRRNVQFMAISGNAQPDHSTIAGFVSGMTEEAEKIFSDIVVRCGKLGLIGGEVFGLDGSRIRSNASKEWSGTFKELERKREKLEAVIRDLIKRHKENDKMTEEEFARKKGKYEDKVRKIERFLEENEPKKGSRSRENKSNITDNESAKMKSSQGYIQGYNGMAMVDEKKQVIVYAEAMGTAGEGKHLERMIEKSGEQLEAAGISGGPEKRKIIADTNYFSEENCRYLEEKKIDGYIPDQFFRKRDPRFPGGNPYREKKGLYKQDKFNYDENKNCYECPAGTLLRYEGRKNSRGYIGRYYRAKKEDCRYCHLRPQCLKKNAATRSLYIIDIYKPKTYSEMMMRKIDTPHGRDMYSRRMGIVEPVFANIKTHKGLDRFTMRGKAKVNVQWLLYCCVHNIGKIAGEMKRSFYFLVCIFRILFFRVRKCKIVISPAYAC
jgi:transposase